MAEDGGRRRSGKARVGGPARGYSWPQAEPGNQLAVKHGSYASVVTFGPRVDEIAACLRELVPGYALPDEPAVRLLAVMHVRIERAQAALEALDGQTDGRELGTYLTADADKLQRLRQDLLGWVNAARRLMNDLGMTPTSRARLGLDLTRARGEALRAHLADRHSAESPGGSEARG